MQWVTEHVDAAYLAQTPPRPLPPGVLLNLLNDYLFERPLRTFLNPLLILCVVALVGLYALRAPQLVRLVPVALIAGQTALAALRLWRRVRDDLALLRHGLAVRAHVLRLRPFRGATGTIEGALLDCAIPVGPRRTYVGSIWLADGAEALRLANQGRLMVLCQPLTPGTWRVIEEVHSDIRYDRKGPMQTIPPDG